MRLQINIVFNSGEAATYLAAPPEWAKWEKQTGNTVTQAANKIGVWDLMFLAYHAAKREAAGKPIKPFDIWQETIADIQVGELDNPKATEAEA